ncbi:hypothetical protein BDV40DRAFT_152766 [Aspergillus tamarii]|uniref:Uncharacterized protein n=1 Tax=Aspergillus tamarii TaxID=41984 RepID=A0A5N6VAP6_ASPTM|nr:hypothetical protein BDV40DRAFT_152766 [Aspergillus tamarii]
MRKSLLTLSDQQHKTANWKLLNLVLFVYYLTIMPKLPTSPAIGLYCSCVLNTPSQQLFEKCFYCSRYSYAFLIVYKPNVILFSKLIHGVKLNSDPQKQST